MIAILIYGQTQFKFARTFELEQKFIFFRVLYADYTYSTYRVTFVRHVDWILLERLNSESPKLK
jgi:hypothetical protein